MFEDILVITILGALCGADTWTELCEFAEAKEEWLKTFLSLPHGIPSHDTFGRVFSHIDPEVFERCFLDWVSSLPIEVSNEIIAIDGKSLRGSYNKSDGHQRPLHLVGAWAVNHGLTLGQVKTAEKSNEIEAIPRLLNMLDIKGSTITIDAMGCQKKIAQQIIDQEAHYVLSLKSNQGSLYHDVISIFKKGKNAKQYKNMLNRIRVEKVHDHGRVETRRYTLISSRDPLHFSLRWPGLKSIGMVEVTRTVNNEVERITRYFLTSLGHESIDTFMAAQRKHWHIEINLHWSLDVSFNEDLCRVRVGHASENLAIVRRIALNLLKQEQSKKIGITAKRKRAGWDNKYLLKLLDIQSNMRDNKQKLNDK